MNPLFLLGWLLLGAAFLSSAAEMLADLTLGGPRPLLSAYDLWYALWPSGLVRAQIHVERALPILWDPLIVGLLALPAWALAGIPGAALAWGFRPGRHLSEEERAEQEQEMQSLFLYDALAKAAEKEGYGDDDEVATPAGALAEPDESGATRVHSPDEYLRGLDGTPAGADARPLPTAKGP
jgi:prepilin signal peptidase PulO-like enzyme (type II secretory pathway)